MEVAECMLNKKGMLLIESLLLLLIIESMIIIIVITAKNIYQLQRLNKDVIDDEQSIQAIYNSR